MSSLVAMHPPQESEPPIGIKNLIAVLALAAAIGAPFIAWGMERQEAQELSRKVASLEQRTDRFVEQFGNMRIFVERIDVQIRDLNEIKADLKEIRRELNGKRP